MEELTLSDASKYNCAMLDGSSFGLFIDYNEFLTERLSSNIAVAIRSGLNENPSRRFERYALQILSGLVVYDFLIVDSRILQAFSNETLAKFGGVVKPLQIPGEIHQSATQITHDFVSALPRSNLDWLKSDDYWDGAAKSYHDTLFREYMEKAEHRLSSALLANSTYSAPRVFYSSEIARSLRVPLFLHPLKESLIERMRGDLNDVVTASFSDVERAIDQHYAKSVENALASLNQSISVATPPLTAYIFRTAEAKNLSLLEAALAMRETKEAVEFRKWLSKVQRKLMADDTATRAIAAKDLNDLLKLVEDWGEHSDPRRGSTHQVRTFKPGELKFSGIPGLGVVLSVMKALDM